MDSFLPVVYLVIPNVSATYDSLVLVFQPNDSLLHLDTSLDHILKVPLNIYQLMESIPDLYLLNVSGNNMETVTFNYFKAFEN